MTYHEKDACCKRNQEQLSWLLHDNSFCHNQLFIWILLNDINTSVDVLMLVQSAGRVSRTQWSGSWRRCAAFTGLLSLVWPLSRYQSLCTFQLRRCKGSAQVGNTRWWSRSVFMAFCTLFVALIVNCWHLVCCPPKVISGFCFCSVLFLLV